jgi:hypothetical protein
MSFADLVSIPGKGSDRFPSLISEKKDSKIDFKSKDSETVSEPMFSVTGLLNKELITF